MKEAKKASSHKKKIKNSHSSLTSMRNKNSISLKTIVKDKWQENFLSFAEKCITIMKNLSLFGRRLRELLYLFWALLMIRKKSGVWVSSFLDWENVKNLQKIIKSPSWNFFHTVPFNHLLNLLSSCPELDTWVKNFYNLYKNNTGKGKRNSVHWNLTSWTMFLLKIRERSTQLWQKRSNPSLYDVSPWCLKLSINPHWLHPLF